MRADHACGSEFIPLTKDAEVPTGPMAAYKNLRQHLEQGDDLIQNSLYDDEPITAEQSA